MSENNIRNFCIIAQIDVVPHFIRDSLKPLGFNILPAAGFRDGETGVSPTPFPSMCKNEIQSKSFD